MRRLLAATVAALALAAPASAGVVMGDVNIDDEGGGAVPRLGQSCSVWGKASWCRDVNLQLVPCVCIRIGDKLIWGRYVCGKPMLSLWELAGLP